MLSFIPVVDEVEELAAKFGMRAEPAFYKQDKTLSSETTKVFTLELDGGVGPLFITRLVILDENEAEVTSATVNIESGTRRLTENGRVPAAGVAMNTVAPILLLRGQRLTVDALFSAAVSADRSLYIEGFHLVNPDGTPPGENGPADEAARMQLRERGEWYGVRQEHALASVVEQTFSPTRPLFVEGVTITAGTDGTIDKLKIGSRDFAPQAVGNTTLAATRLRAWARPPEQLRSRRAAGMATGSPKVNFYCRIVWG